ncbi:MAG: hypothetical protein ACRDZW_02530, partial [Acidimicrobiales bacterium]
STLALWRAALVVNALLAGITVVLTLALARRLAPDMSDRGRLVAVTAAALYPPVLLWSNLAIAENLLIPAFVATVLLAWRALDSGRPRDWAAAGAGASVIYASHPRGLVAPLSLVVVALVTLRPLGAHRRQLGAVVAGAGVVAAAAWVLAGWVSRDVPGAARVNDVSSTLTKNLGPGTARTLAAELAGQVWYLTVATGGLFALGMAAALGAVVALLRSRGRADPPTAGLAFVGLAMLAMVGLGSLFINNDTRIDYLIYGRYNEGLVVPVVLIGLLALGRRLSAARARPWAALIRPAAVVGATLVVSAAVLVAGRGADRVNLPLVRTNVLGIDALLRGHHQVLSVSLFSAAGLAAAALVLAAGRVRPVAAGAMAGLLFLPSVATGRAFMVEGSRQRAIERKVADAVVAVGRRVGGVPGRCVGYDLAGASDWHRANYELFLPRVRLRTFASRRGQSPCSSLAISGRPDFTTTFPGSRRVRVENFYDQALWVLPGSLQQELASVGWLLPQDLRGPLPRGASRYSIRPRGGLRLPAVTSMRRGGRRSVEVAVTNASSVAPWPSTKITGTPERAIQVGVRWYRLGRPGLPDGFAMNDQTRIELPGTMLPGETERFEVPLEAVTSAGRPLPPGTYEVHVEVVQKAVAWFVAVGPPLIIEVVVVDRVF